MEKKVKQTAIRLSATTKQLLEQLCELDSRSMTNMIEHLIKKEADGRGLKSKPVKQ